jgi:hypothetical protein
MTERVIAAFNATALFPNVKDDQYYRVYLTRNEVYFAELGGGSPLLPIPGMLVWAMAKQLILWWRRDALIREMDAMPVEDVLFKRPKSFSALPADFLEAQLNPPAVDASFHPMCWGTWIVRLADREQLMLLFPELDDMETAMLCLPIVLGRVLQVNAVWSETEGHYVQRIDGDA